MTSIPIPMTDAQVYGICAAALVIGIAGIWLLERLFDPRRKGGKR